MANTELGPGHLINWLLCSPPSLAPVDNISNKQNKKLLNSNNKQNFFASFVSQGMTAARNENNKIIDFWLTSGLRSEKACCDGKHKNQNRDNSDTNNPRPICHDPAPESIDVSRDSGLGLWRGAGPSGVLTPKSRQSSSPHGLIRGPQK